MEAFILKRNTKKTEDKQNGYLIKQPPLPAPKRVNKMKEMCVLIIDGTMASARRKKLLKLGDRGTSQGKGLPTHTVIYTLADVLLPTPRIMYAVRISITPDDNCFCYLDNMSLAGCFHA